MTYTFQLLTFSNTLSNRFFIYSLSHLNIISSFFYSFFNIFLFFLYSIYFFKFQPAIFFFFNFITFSDFAAKRQQEERNFFYFSCLILLVDFNDLTVLEFEKTTRRIQEKKYKGKASFHLFCEKQWRESMREKKSKRKRKN